MMEAPAWTADAIVDWLAGARRGAVAVSPAGRRPRPGDPQLTWRSRPSQ